MRNGTTLDPARRPAAEAALRSANLLDRIEASRAEARRRLTWMGGLMVFVPISMSHEAFLTVHGARTFVALMLLTIAALGSTAASWWRAVGRETADLVGALLTSEHIVAASRSWARRAADPRHRPGPRNRRH